MTACALLIGSHVIVAAGGSVAMDRTEVARGKQIFVKYCAGCHGSQGKGDGYQLLGPDPANLMSPTTEERSDDDLLRTIHEGKPNMPAWKHRFRVKIAGMFSPISAPCRPCKESRVRVPSGRDTATKPNAAKPARTIRTSPEHYEGVGFPERTTRTGHATWCTIA
jgi:hypothetical protein